MTNIFNYLKECNDKIGPITIDQEFIDYRNEKKRVFAAKGRNETQRLMDADCLIIEYTLHKLKLAEEPPKNIIEYDIGLPQFKSLTDIKIFKKWFNIPADSTVWYTRNIRKNLLTDFAFYKWINAPTRPLEVGDIVQTELISVENAEHVLKNVEVSQWEGYYYIPKAQK